MNAIDRLRVARAEGGQWWFAGALTAALVGYGVNTALRPETSTSIVLTLFLFWRVSKGGSVALFVLKCLFMLGIVFMTLALWDSADRGGPGWLHVFTFAAWSISLYCLTAPAVERFGKRGDTEVPSTQAS